MSYSEKAVSTKSNIQMCELTVFVLRGITSDKELSFNYHDVDEPQIISDKMADAMKEKNG